MSTPERGPDVRVPPPLLFAGGMLVAWLLHRWLPFEIDDDGAGAIQSMAGSVMMIAGGLLVIWAFVTFTRARTAIIPHRPARRLVTEGPYRFTRNPIYGGLTVTYVGLSIALNAAWPIFVLPLVLVLLGRLVVRREERYLGAKFGQDYAAYCRRVRRWF